MRRRKGRKQVDISSRTTSKNRKLDGEFLDGTESSVIEIEPTATSGFQEAWRQQVDEQDDQTLDAAISVGQDDSRVRNLDGTRTGLYLGVAAFLIGVGAIAFFATQAATAPDPNLGARASADTERNVLSSPLAEREYSDLETPVAIAMVSPVDRFFVDDGELIPTESAPAEAEGGEGQVLFGPVFWAGRTHIAVVGETPLFWSENGCLVTSLVASDLQAIDVAGVGECGEVFDATGDRIACSGENVVLVEVWPFNPDSVTEPRTVSAIRTRIEERSGGQVSSRRGSLVVPDEGAVSPIVAAATTLDGRPGDMVTIQLGELAGECALIDRSTVDVRLLPG